MRIISRVAVYQRELNFIILMSALYMGAVWLFSSSSGSPSARVSFAALAILLYIVDVTCLIIAKRQSDRLNFRLQVAVFVAIIALQLAVVLEPEPFVTRTALVGAQCLLIAVHFLFSNKRLRVTPMGPRMHPLELVGLLWVAVPLVSHVTTNPEWLTPETRPAFFAILLAIPLALLGIVHYLQRRFLTRQIGMPVLLALFYVFYSWPTITGALKQTADQSIYYRLPVLAAAIALFVWLHKRARRGFYACAGIIITVLLLQSVLFDRGDSTGAEGKEPAKETLALPDRLSRKPDILLLVFDGYVGSRLLNQFNICNADHEEHLKSLGFTFYERTYSLYAISVGSISRMLDMSRDVQNPRAVIGGGSTVNRYLQEQGYRTHYLLSPYLTLNQPQLGDYHYPDVDESKTFGLKTKLKGIATGEFRSDLVYASAFTYKRYLKEKAAVLSSPAGQPKFLYAHSPWPGHSQNSGSCQPDEADIYTENLQKAVAEMKTDVENIMAANREAIIILAGDHGPYLAGDCHNLTGYQESDITNLHLSDRFSVFLAIRWPESLEKRFDDIRILQDVFFSVFATLGESGRLMDSRLQTSTIGPMLHNGIRDGIVRIGKDIGARIY